MQRKYQTGMNKTVYEIIKQSHEMGLKYIPTFDITEQVKKIRPDISQPYGKVRQALYQLQRNTKFKNQRIKKFYDRYGKRKGWAIENKLHGERQEVESFI
jgi:hypothetical protein